MAQITYSFSTPANSSITFTTSDTPTIFNRSGTGALGYTITGISGTYGGETILGLTTAFGDDNIIFVSGTAGYANDYKSRVATTYNLDSHGISFKTDKQSVNIYAAAGVLRDVSPSYARQLAVQNVTATQINVEVNGQTQLAVGTVLDIYTDNKYFTTSSINTDGYAYVGSAVVRPSFPGSSTGVVSFSGTVPYYLNPNTSDIVVFNGSTQVTGLNVNVTPLASSGDSISARSLFGAPTYDLTSHAATAWELYRGILNRTPTPLDLEVAVSQLDGGVTPVSLAQSLLVTSEYTSANSNLTNDQFVTLLYQDALGRAPDSGGRSGFVGELNSGTPRAQVAVEIATSTEALGQIVDPFYAGIFVPDATDAGIARLYYGLLNRAPDPGGLLNWEGFVKTGGHSLTEVAAQFIASPEGSNELAGLSNQAFVNALYQNALGRQADSGGSANFTNALNAGASRASVAIAIAESGEALGHLAPVIESGFKLTA